MSVAISSSWSIIDFNAEDAITSIVVQLFTIKFKDASYVHSVCVRYFSRYYQTNEAKNKSSLIVQIYSSNTSVVFKILCTRGSESESLCLVFWCF